jgi:hypothetical protein
MIRLTEQPDGMLTEDGTDVAFWVTTTYTEPREALDECADCRQPITEWDLMICLDGGDTAHTGCVEITKP